jgi:hypothetical protein
VTNGDIVFKRVVVIPRMDSHLLETKLLGSTDVNRYGSLPSEAHLLSALLQPLLP